MRDRTLFLFALVGLWVVGFAATADPVDHYERPAIELSKADDVVVQTFTSMRTALIAEDLDEIHSLSYTMEEAVKHLDQFSSINGPSYQTILALTEAIHLQSEEDGDLNALRDLFDAFEAQIAPLK